MDGDIYQGPGAWLSQEKKGGLWRFVVKNEGEEHVISDFNFTSQAAASIALRNYLFGQGYEIISVRALTSKPLQCLLN